MRSAPRRAAPTPPLAEKPPFEPLDHRCPLEHCVGGPPGAEPAIRPPAPLSKHAVGCVGSPPTPKAQSGSGPSARQSVQTPSPPFCERSGALADRLPPARRYVEADQSHRPRRTNPHAALQTICERSRTISRLETAAYNRHRRPDLAGRPPAPSPNALCRWLDGRHSRSLARSPPAWRTRTLSNVLRSRDSMTLRRCPAPADTISGPSRVTRSTFIRIECISLP